MTTVLSLYVDIHSPNNVIHEAEHFGRYNTYNYSNIYFYVRYIMMYIYNNNILYINKYKYIYFMYMYTLIILFYSLSSLVLSDSISFELVSHGIF